jgi:hypothetical protein
LLQTFALTAQHFSDPTKETVYPNLATFNSLLDILDVARVPDDIIQYFSSSYFVALHKDIEDNSKLQPIGIGTHLHRVLGTLETYQHLAEFAEALWPYQFAIGIPSGIQLLTHCFQTLIYKYLPGSPTATTASGALAIVNKYNMFNECSRMTYKHEPEHNHADLVPIFDLLYFNDNDIYYQ